jgi:hypothetical protein
MSDWTPTPQAQLPDPNAVKAMLDPELGEGTDGYISPDDIKDVIQALASYDFWMQDQVISNLNVLSLLAQEIGNIHILGQPDLVTAIHALEARVIALENDPGTQAPPPAPTSEGEVVIDKYSGSFIRARAGTGLDLSDGQDHWFVFALATTAGTGGEVYASVDDIPQQGSAVWFDDGGHLGHVKAVTGADLMSNSLINYMTGSTTHGARLCRGRLDKTTDPAHPNLLLQEVLH